MKSQINLLHRQFVPKFEWVCASHFMSLIILTLLLGAGIYGGVFYMHHQAQSEVTTLQSLVDREQAMVNELSVALTERAGDPALENRLTKIMQQTDAKKRLLAHIQNMSTLKQRSFSSLFDALSEASSDELWLTRFAVTPDELSLEGEIAKPKALPLWIKQLSATEFFKGQQFNGANLEREDDKLIFELNSVDKQDAQTIAQAGVSK